jgi:hypothetical protein
MVVDVFPSIPPPSVQTWLVDQNPLLPRRSLHPVRNLSRDQDPIHQTIIWVEKTLILHPQKKMGHRREMMIWPVDHRLEHLVKVGKQLTLHCFTRLLKVSPRMVRKSSINVAPFVGKCAFLFSSFRSHKSTVIRLIIMALAQAVPISGII